MSKEKRSIWHEKWCTKVEEQRKTQNLTQKQVAECLGISRRYYNQLITGKKPLKRKMYKEIRAVLKQLDPENLVTVIVDYLRVRFPLTGMDGMKRIAHDILEIPFKFFRKEKHRWHNYEHVYSFGNIFLSYSDDEKMGIILEFKGQACRQYEIHLEYHGYTWINFLATLWNQDVKWKRLDLAINDYDGILNIEYLHKKCKTGEFVTRCKSFDYRESGETNYYEELDGKLGLGRTLYIGKRSSAIYICMYEKDYEQYITKGVPLEDAPIKNRLEIRLSDERAERTVEELITNLHHGECAEDEILDEIIFGILNHYLYFVVEDKNQPKNEWELDPIWERFCYGRTRNIRIATNPKPFDLDAKYNWIIRQVAPTAKTLLVHDYQKGRTDLIDAINNAKPNEELRKAVELETQMIAKMKVKSKGIAEMQIEKMEVKEGAEEK